MSRDAQAPLFHPFESGDLPVPAEGSRGLFLAASSKVRPPSEFNARLTLVQGFRPDFLALQRDGRAAIPQADGAEFDFALVLAGRHRGENEARLAIAIARVRRGGLIVMAGGKSDGISSLRKRLQKVLPLGGHMAKNHGEVLWLERGSDAVQFGAALTSLQAASPLVEQRFRTAPGMFSHEHVDAGSRLLAENLPTGLKGAAADFCAGWGYLSVALAERAPAITAIDLFEADYASLEAARQNMATLVPSMPASFHWLDLEGEKVERKYDVAVMNPPFHQGRAADPGIGLAMIRAAAAGLKAGGRLFVVANRGLPYDAALNTAFGKVTELAADKTFRVWLARR